MMLVAECADNLRNNVPGLVVLLARLAELF
jgi:hypothetical protein